MSNTPKNPSKQSAREQLIRYIAQKNGMKLNKAQETLDIVIEGISKLLQEGNRLMFLPLGSFSVQDKPAMQGRNPKTSESIHIPAYKALRFKVSTAMKASLNPDRKPSVTVQGANKEVSKKTKK